MGSKELGIELEDLNNPQSEEPNGSGWLNFFLIRRRNSRGDLVGSIALWSFAAILICLLLGGSSYKTETIYLVIPAIDWTTLTGLLTPIVAHVLKGTVESVNGK